MLDHPMRTAIQRALFEDLGPGDVTTDATVSPEAEGEASLIAKEDLVLAGLPVFHQVFLELDADIGFEAFFEEGRPVPAGDRVCLLTGRLSTILKGERTALNFIQRMSGIATLTRRYVDRISATGGRILDTRKTAPGLRLFDKYAVRMGGGVNHRFGLSDGVLIKDNHIAAAGSIGKAVALARRESPHTLKVETEVEDLAGVQEALDAGADIILLDNMPVAQIRAAVKLVDGRAMLEASGGVNLDTVKAIAETGVYAVSVGALTHSARAMDLSLEIISA
ncbi:MAG: carboxylating nicotinate-nucleotide diphosphorylase [Deltaproteobacteria bacterium]|nr:carboxylating nicotinate-nucleotide diphosphorylase [Deltaproteobacteria bacterium]